MDVTCIQGWLQFHHSMLTPSCACVWCSPSHLFGGCLSLLCKYNNNSAAYSAACERLPFLHVWRSTQAMHWLIDAVGGWSCLFGCHTAHFSTSSNCNCLLAACQIVHKLYTVCLPPHRPSTQKHAWRTHHKSNRLTTYARLRPRITTQHMLSDTRTTLPLSFWRIDKQPHKPKHTVNGSQLQNLCRCYC